jgi:hypothetical protein
VNVQLNRIGDLITIRYSRPGITVESMRVGFGCPHFRNDLRKWISGGRKEAFTYCVDAEIVLV